MGLQRGGFAPRVRGMAACWRLRMVWLGVSGASWLEKAWDGSDMAGLAEGSGDEEDRDGEVWASLRVSEHGRCGG